VRKSNGYCCELEKKCGNGQERVRFSVPLPLHLVLLVLCGGSRNITIIFGVEEVPVSNFLELLIFV
jgi:hypothetical protein